MVEFSPIVATTVLDFIDYAAFAVIIMIIYYGIKLVFYRTKEEEEAEKTRVEGTRDWIKGKYEEHKQKETERKTGAEQEAQARERRRLLEPAKGWMIKSEQHAEEGLDSTTPYNASRLRNHISQVKTNVHSAKRIIRVARIHAKGERRDYLEKLGAFVETIEQIVSNNLELNPPKVNTAPTSAQINNIRTHLKNIKIRCSVVIKSIDEFIDEDKMNISGAGIRPSPTPGIRPSPSPGIRP
ncbi:hypothetical protein HYX11_00295 [Candidatus Woesearchaeota archaeon]|nr:hypothetical protein [Candidatus Woesearchaeota archaeon]